MPPLFRRDDSSDPSRLVEVACDVRTCHAAATTMCAICAGWFCPAHATASAAGLPLCAECWALVPQPLHHPQPPTHLDGPSERQVPS